MIRALLILNIRSMTSLTSGTKIILVQRELLQALQAHRLQILTAHRIQLIIVPIAPLQKTKSLAVILQVPLNNRLVHQNTVTLVYRNTRYSLITCCVKSKGLSHG